MFNHRFSQLPLSLKSISSHFFPLVYGYEAGGFSCRQNVTLTEAELEADADPLKWNRPEPLVAALPTKNALAYNSVLTTIRILEQKGYVLVS